MRILLVEDHKATRDEIRVLIEGQSGMTVVAEAENGEDGVKQARKVRPDVVVMDILLPGMNGIEATRKILVELPETRILALSNHFGAGLVQAILEAGGLGYVRKNRALEELIPALQSVSEGRQYVGGQSAVK
jgi:two-component system invasion response regulator UvrY